MDTDKDMNISKLLRLKRYEQPPPGYYDDFMREFHRRQRAEMMQRPSWGAAWERLTSYVASFHVPQFAYASIVAMAIGASIVILIPKQTEAPALAQSSASNPSFSLTSARPVTISDTLPVSAPADGSLPPHYVLQSRPVSNEKPLSF
jgi:hypothetical protein